MAIFTLIFIAQIVPAYAGPLFAREKERETWDLLLTTITHSRMLLNGKLAGALYQCLFRAGILFGVPFLLSSLLFGFIQLWGLASGPPFYWRTSWVTPSSCCCTCYSCCKPGPTARSISTR